MFFLVPYAVDVPFDRKPVVNWLLVMSVIAAFGWQFAVYQGAGLEEQIGPYVLDGWSLQGLIGHLWLHADPIHLGGNMLFLWVFGNAVCAKVGNAMYLPIYLAVGLGAAAGHLLLNGGPAIGASGAINGIVGMFLIFFWQNEMDCAFFGWIVLRPIYRTFSIASYWMIGLWLIFDIVGALRGGGQIAYGAHLGGFVSGAVLAVVLLKLKWVTMYRDEQSLVDALAQWRQDRQDARLEKIARAAVDHHLPDTDKPHPRAAQPPLILFACKCGQRFKMPAQHAGRKGLCPHCKEPIIVPSPKPMQDAAGPA